MYHDTNKANLSLHHNLILDIAELIYDCSKY